MHPELEKLIDLAVVDGKITDKEKEVLHRKAKELGEDIDELDLVLEAKLFIQNKDSNATQSQPAVVLKESEKSLSQENIRVKKFFNEDYKEYLKKIICRNKIYFGKSGPRPTSSRIIEGIDPIKYLNENITINTLLFKGELLLHLSIKELLISKLFDNIIYIFNKSAKKEIEEDYESYAVKLYLDGEIEKSRYELEKLITSHEIYVFGELRLIGAAYCFSLLFNDSNRAKELLEKVPPEGNEIYLAEAWKLLFNNNNKVTSIIVEGELRKDIFEDVLLLRSAYMWKELLGDDREANRCIRISEELSKPRRIFGNLAKAWKQLFNDDSEAKRCIKEYEKEAIAENFDLSVDYRIASGYWKKILNDDNEARRCLKTAEDIADKEDKSELKTVAEYWEDIFNDSESAMRCMQKYESKEKPSKSWWKR